MSRYRALTAVEIARLDAVGRVHRRAPNATELERARLNLINVTGALHVDGVPWTSMVSHLGMTTGKLTRLRRRKPGVALGSVARASLPPITLTLAGESAGLEIGRDSLQASFTSMSSSALASALENAPASSAFAAGTNAAGVFVALGFPEPGTDGRAGLRLGREGKLIDKAMSSRSSPRISLDTTPGDLQDLALGRPFILHVAAHREMGVTMLADSDGQRLPVLDDDLVRLLAPEAGAPAVLMLSFCDSYEVAEQLEHRDMAVISFVGSVLDEGALAFYRHVYEAIARGRTIQLAFEVGSAATRGAYGLEPRLNPYSSSHDRPLPL